MRVSSFTSDMDDNIFADFNNAYTTYNYDRSFNSKGEPIRMERQEKTFPEKVKSVYVFSKNTCTFVGLCTIVWFGYKASCKIDEFCKKISKQNKGSDDPNVIDAEFTVLK